MGVRRTRTLRGDQAKRLDETRDSRTIFADGRLSVSSDRPAPIMGLSPEDQFGTRRTESRCSAAQKVQIRWVWIKTARQFSSAETTVNETTTVPLGGLDASRGGLVPGIVRVGGVAASRVEPDGEKIRHHSPGRGDSTLPGAKAPGGWLEIKNSLPAGREIRSRPAGRELWIDGVATGGFRPRQGAAAPSGLLQCSGLLLQLGLLLNLGLLERPHTHVFYQAYSAPTVKPCRTSESRKASN